MVFSTDTEGVEFSDLGILGVRALSDIPSMNISALKLLMLVLETLGYLLCP